MNANLSLFTSTSISRAAGILSAARALAPALAKGKSLDRTMVRDVMSFAFMGSDAEGVWNWKDAYDAIEAAQVLHLRKHACQVEQLEDAPANTVAMLQAVNKLGLTHTRRSEEQIALDQFSSPPELAALAVLAAQVRPGDTVLEPSAGTGIIAILAEISGGKLHLNEIAANRADLLDGLFPLSQRSRLDGATLHDRLPSAGSFDAVVMNPPFGPLESHLLSAGKALADGGRVCALVPGSFFTSDAASRLARLFDVRAAILLPDASFAKHGTKVETGLLVFDRIPSTGGMPPIYIAEGLAEAVEAVLAVPPRHSARKREFRSTGQNSAFRAGTSLRPVASSRLAFLQSTAPVAYQVVEWAGSGQDVGLYSSYRVARLLLDSAHPHPSLLVESAAMGSVSPPAPTYRPLLPSSVADGGLSDAQMETVIYAGQAHEEILPGFWALNEGKTAYTAVPSGHPGGFQLRKGFFLGDGTGVGKGRQISAVIADNMARGRTRAIWISKNDELLDDARRDWTGIGGGANDLFCQNTYKLGAPIRADKGILFTTYATLRVGGRQEKKSRLDQIVDWLGEDFDGTIVFDEAHEMANAAGGKGNRGAKKPSQQGLAGLMLQYRLPDARVMYVSATGATTPENLGYACRLGLWGSAEAPFMTREEFLKAADDGGVAVMELIARELKAQGLYTARMLSFEGLTIDPLLHELTPANIEIWDAWAEAFEIIHANLDKALEATGVVVDGQTSSGQAKSAAKSAFAGTCQRFFNALLCGFKTPTVIGAIEEDLTQGHACVVQLVSTNQAVMERRLDAVSPAEWNDLNIDLTPRDTVTEYLEHSFPTTCLTEVQDDNGNILMVPLTDSDGNAVHSQEALALRDDLILSLATLPGVPGVLDSLVHHFGPERLSEITGRNRRVILKGDRMVLERRPASSAKTETDDFMGGRKDVLVFSQAGGTGRSYHADRACKNHKRRRHYLVEAGWRADNAIQGIGRTHRSNQVSAPCFRPVTTSIKGEKRFLSTIARRLDSLGALTKGERRSAGNGLFRAEDNLENEFARRALQAFYLAMYQGKIECMGIGEFERKTALRLRDGEGALASAEDLPPLHAFLNRMLALRINDQNNLFDAFETRLKAILERAEATGQLDKGVEDLLPDQVELLSEEVIRTDRSGAETRLLTFRTRQRRHVASLESIVSMVDGWPRSRFDFVCNTKSEKVALVERGITATGDDDGLFAAVRLHRPLKREVIDEGQFAESSWQVIDEKNWRLQWDVEISKLDPFVTKDLHLGTGLLLPIWKSLPDKHCYVKRLRAPDGRSWLGRTLSEGEAVKLRSHLGVEQQDGDLASPRKVRDIVMKNIGGIKLTQGLRLKRSTVMDKPRLEVCGNPEETRRLRDLGCFVEIINHSARVFVPVADEAVMAAILRSYPAQQVLAN